MRWDRWVARPDGKILLNDVMVVLSIICIHGVITMVALRGHVVQHHTKGHTQEIVCRRV